MGSSRAAAGGLLGIVRDFQRFGPTETLRQLNLERLASRPAADAFVAILEFICPPGGSVDDGIARQAMLESIGELAETVPGTFDTLTPAQMREFFLDFIARSIEGRILADIGTRGITVPDDIVAVENMQAQLHDFVTGATRGQLVVQLTNLTQITDAQTDSVVNRIYEAAFDLVAAAGQALG